MQRLKSALIRVDGRPESGFGHIRRCITLAESLENQGWQCTLAFEEACKISASHLGRLKSFPLTDCLSLGEEIAALGGLRSEPWDLLIVDHYQRDIDFEKAFAESAVRTLVIDDLANRPHQCDFLIDQSGYDIENRYRALTPNSCQFLTGTGFALLGAVFKNTRLKTLQARVFEGVKRVLVSFGGADTHNLTERSLNALLITGLGLEIDVVISPAAASYHKIKAMAGSASVYIHENVGLDKMAQLMSSADLAIGAAGGTSWERCCLGLPSVVIVTARNQDNVAQELKRQEAALVLGWHDDITEVTIAEVVQQLNASPERLSSLSQQSSRVCDGWGADLIATALSTPDHEEAKEPLWLRRASLDDLDLVYYWQCAPETRNHFRNPNPPTLNEHVAWMTGKLCDPSCIFALVIKNGVPVGVLRLDSEKGGDVYEVSILTAPGYYRQGIGHAALAMARSLVPKTRLKAFVSEENKASIGMFKKAGYQIDGDWLVNWPSTTIQ